MMIQGFTIFMGVACLVSLFVIAFLVTAFVLLCIKTVDPTNGGRTLPCGHPNPDGSKDPEPGWYSAVGLAGPPGTNPNRYTHICEDCESDYDEVLVLGPSGGGGACPSVATYDDLELLEPEPCSCGVHECCSYDSKMSTQVLLDHVYPTAKTAVIGKDIGEFELITSTNV